MHVPYVVPQECGGRADVLWTALQDAKGHGLLIEHCCADAPAAVEGIERGCAAARPAGTSGAQVSASRWTPTMVACASHDFELPHGADRPIAVHVDTAHCGIGGTGGATEAVWRFYPQYYVDPKTPAWNYGVVLTPLMPGQLQVECPKYGTASSSRS
jgi:beta-galactosidase